ncbi:MAG: permease [Firmicutes bacterium]|nr:permease [Bacillota bacterium]
MLNDTLTDGLSGILMNLALPALIVRSFIFEFSPDMLKNAALVVGLSVIVHAILLFINKIIFRKYHFDKRNVLIFSGVFPNAGFMGLPLIYAIFGQIGIFYASIFMVPYQILLWTYGQDLFRRETSNVSRFRQILSYSKNPAILAVFAGLIIFLFSIQLPYPLKTSLSLVGDLTMPLAMMVVGDKIVQIKAMDIVSDKDVYFSAIVRLILIPIVTFGVLKAFPIEETIIHVCVTVEALPPAVAGVIFAQVYEGDAVFASKCVVIQHALSLVTIPMMLILLK